MIVSQTEKSACLLNAWFNLKNVNMCSTTNLPTFVLGLNTYRRSRISWCYEGIALGRRLGMGDGSQKLWYVPMIVALSNGIINPIWLFIVVPAINVLFF
jgi:hypothetical protein